MLGVIAAICAGMVSLFASAFPDGLEWSMEHVAGTAELEATGGIYQALGTVQNVTSIFPDYAFRHSDSAAGTSVSGLVGGVVVLVLCVGICYLLRRKNSTSKESNS